MSFGLSNSAKRSRFYGQTVNQNQGGGNKKAGFPYIVGRGWRSNIALGTLHTGTSASRCVGLPALMQLCFTGADLQTRSRPIGGDIKTVYWH